MDLSWIAFCLFALVVNAAKEAESVPPPALERFVSKLLAGDHSACSGLYQTGNVYVTLVNSYHFRLLRLQREALELEGHRECVESQYVTVCIDEGCMNDCSFWGIPHCVRIPSYEDVGPSDFAQGDYWHTSLIHHRLARDTLAVPGVVSTCILDADILLFASPTDHYNRTAYPYTGTLEGGDGCGAMINGGFQCFLNTPMAVAFTDKIVTMNETWLRGEMDQDQFPGIADSLGLARCPLDPELFTGHCGGSRRDTGLMRNLVSYHTNCATGEDKFRLMSQVLDAKTRVVGGKDSRERTLEGLL